MANFEDLYFKSSTGVNTIHALICTPEQSPRGIVQIVHGISEHIDRYKNFMEFLAENGFAVIGNDHLGHGKSVAKPEEKGLFCENDGWGHVVSDLVKVNEIAREKFPGVKYIMFGHSMGSFLTRTFIVKHPEKYDMAIISGTGHQGKLLITAGNMLAGMAIKSKGYDSDGAKLNNLCMGSYLKKIKSPKTPFDWLSRDEKMVEKYARDESCGFVCKAGLYADMMKGIRFVTDMANISKVDKDKPVYFMSGSEDPVGDYGKGVRTAYECFRKAGVKDVTMKLYEGGRHEMLNEINSEEVYTDILNWLNERV